MLVEVVRVEEEEEEEEVEAVAGVGMRRCRGIELGRHAAGLGDVEVRGMEIWSSGGMLRA